VLWQFTGNGIGPKPQSIPGIIDTGMDINHFDGDAVKLVIELSAPTTVAATEIMKRCLLCGVKRTSRRSAGMSLYIEQPNTG
jgi:hypothetical protein